jgi:hypothetical protein
MAYVNSDWSGLLFLEFFSETKCHWRVFAAGGIVCLIQHTTQYKKYEMFAKKQEVAPAE